MNIQGDCKILKLRKASRFPVHCFETQQDGMAHMSQEFTEFLELFGCWGSHSKTTYTVILQWILCLFIFCQHFVVVSSVYYRADCGEGEEMCWFSLLGLPPPCPRHRHRNKPCHLYPSITTHCLLLSHKTKRQFKDEYICTAPTLRYITSNIY